MQRSELTGLLALLLAALPALGAGGTPDPVFKTVPFDEWLNSRQQAQWHWTTTIEPVRLSVHQRWFAQMEMRLDTRDIARHGGQGSVVFLIQITDAKGLVFQDHFDVQRMKLDEGSRGEIVCTESAFVTPGDYSIVFAVFDTVTKDHAIKRSKLHVDTIKNDPLPNAWRDLPSVEFRNSTDPPDLWFVPNLIGDLFLPVHTSKPLQLDIVLNMTPSEKSTRILGNQSAVLSALIPTLKAVSRIGAPDSFRELRLVDLTQRREVFRQPVHGPLDWEALKQALTDSPQHIINVKALADRKRTGEFFLEELGRTLSAGTEARAHAVIVLSGAMQFDSPQDISDAQVRLPAGARVFYIRYRPQLHYRVIEQAPRQRRSRIGLAPLPPPDMDVDPGSNTDNLFPLMKQLSPQLFDVWTAADLRAAIASILTEIGKM